MITQEDRRNFTRYPLDSECELSIENETYTGRTIDYSAEGVCAEFRNSPPLVQDALCDLTIPDSDMHYPSKIVWVNENNGVIKAGFQRIMGLQGTLEYFNLSDILIGLQKTTKTGILSVTSGEIEKKIFIRNGDVIFSSSNDPNDRLGEMLLREGIITFNQYNQASELIKTSKERLGRILVRLGLAPREVFLGVKRQIAAIIMSIFQFEHGEFEFIEGPLPSEELITLQMSVSNLIYTGIKNITSFSLVKKMSPPVDSLLTISHNPYMLFQNVSIDTDDRAILSYINGRNSLQTILDISFINNLDTMKIICALLHIGYIRTVKEGDDFIEPPIEDIIGTPEKETSEEFLSKVDQLYNSIENLGHYEILGVERYATSKEIATAYYSLSRQFHPDRHFEIPSHDVKGKLVKILYYIDDSYKTLSDTELREQYDRILSSTPETETAPGEDTVLPDNTAPAEEVDKHEPEPVSVHADTGTAPFMESEEQQVSGQEGSGAGHGPSDGQADESLTIEAPAEETALPDNTVPADGPEEEPAGVHADFGHESFIEAEDQTPSVQEGSGAGHGPSDRQADESLTTEAPAEETALSDNTVPADEPEEEPAGVHADFGHESFMESEEQQVSGQEGSGAGHGPSDGQTDEPLTTEAPAEETASFTVEEGPPVSEQEAFETEEVLSDEHVSQVIESISRELDSLQAEEDSPESDELQESEETPEYTAAPGVSDEAEEGAVEAEQGQSVNESLPHEGVMPSSETAQRRVLKPVAILATACILVAGVLYFFFSGHSGKETHPSTPVAAIASPPAGSTMEAQGVSFPLFREDAFRAVLHEASLQKE